MDTIDPWLMSLAPTNEDSAWLAEVKTFLGKKLPSLSANDKLLCVVSLTLTISNNKGVRVCESRRYVNI